MPILDHFSPPRSVERVWNTFALRVLICCLMFAAFTLPLHRLKFRSLPKNKGEPPPRIVRCCVCARPRRFCTRPRTRMTKTARCSPGSRANKASGQVLLTLNRGEGGANLIGPERYDALGILRTEELLAAGRYYGVYQMFTRVTDFGFSKRLDETLEHWGREVVLGDVVHAIRLYRPDIIVSRYHGTQRDGHGNHQAAGLMSIEAFKAAADPNRFPEHLQEACVLGRSKALSERSREGADSDVEN